MGFIQKFIKDSISTEAWIEKDMKPDLFRRETFGFRHFSLGFIIGFSGWVISTLTFVIEIGMNKRMKASGNHRPHLAEVTFPWTE